MLRHLWQGVTPSHFNFLSRQGTQLPTFGSVLVKEPRKRNAYDFLTRLRLSSDTSGRLFRPLDVAPCSLIACRSIAGEASKDHASRNRCRNEMLDLESFRIVNTHSSFIRAGNMIHKRGSVTLSESLIGTISATRIWGAHKLWGIRTRGKLIAP